MSGQFEIARDPINRDVARAMQGGEHHVPKGHAGAGQDRYEERIREILAMPQKPRPPKLVTPVKDWAGEKVGRLTVVCYSHSRKSNPKKGTLHFWVVRCLCGNYEMRRQQSLGRLERGADGCAICQQKWNAVRSHEFRITGIDCAPVDPLRPGTKSL